VVCVKYLNLYLTAPRNIYEPLLIHKASCEPGILCIEIIIKTNNRAGPQNRLEFTGPVGSGWNFFRSIPESSTRASRSTPGPPGPAPVLPGPLQGLHVHHQCHSTFSTMGFPVHPRASRSNTRPSDPFKGPAQGPPGSLQGLQVQSRISRSSTSTTTSRVQHQCLQVHSLASRSSSRASWFTLGPLGSSTRVFRSTPGPPAPLLGFQVQH